jgi:xylulokinase
MHGLVIVDKQGRPLRNSIIWCDSRAVGAGEKLTAELPEHYIKKNLLNNISNFTAAKLFWVKQNEASVFECLHKVMLPGDYIAYKMSGDYTSTITGMSEGIFYDFFNDELSNAVLDAIGINKDKFPHLGSSLEALAVTNESFSILTGIKPGTPISYRAGDQPNNALSLGVLKAGEAAGTGGTSGVIYAVSDQVNYDPSARVNTFAHVNYTAHTKLFGTLMCINGTGILYNWLKSNFYPTKTYQECESIARTVSIGSDGLIVLPFGNGAERILENKVLGASMHYLDLNRHTSAHMIRAGLEGIAYSFAYGIEILKDLGIKISSLKVGNDNLFQSQIFSNTLSSLAEIDIKVIETTGAVGAAIASAYGIGFYKQLEEGFDGLKIVQTYESRDKQYEIGYQEWKRILELLIKFN